MAVEAVDARHEAILCLHRATLAVEAGCLHQAETHALSAVAWLRNVLPKPCAEGFEAPETVGSRAAEFPKPSTEGRSLQDDDVRESSSGWTYRP